MGFTIKDRKNNRTLKNKSKRVHKLKRKKNDAIKYKKIKGGSLSDGKKKTIEGTYDFMVNVKYTNREESIKMTPTKYKIGDKNLKEFKSTIKAELTPMDCFINALQLIGIFDIFTSNVLRISCTGKYGVTEEQIEMIFTLYHGYKFENTPYFEFMNIGNYDYWHPIVGGSLQPGEVMLVGWKESTGAHTFLVGKHLNGDVVYLDPQIPTNCSLKLQDCVTLLRKNEKPDRNYFILYNSIQPIKSIEILKDLGFDLTPGRDVDHTNTLVRP
jgi:hypothetical protein